MYIYTSPTRQVERAPLAPYYYPLLGNAAQVAPSPSVGTWFVRGALAIAALAVVYTVYKKASGETALRNPLPPWPGIGPVPPPWLGPVYSLGPFML